MKKIKKALTFVELIVVLGILAILLSIFWIYFNTIFVDARNADRKINVTLLANALKEFGAAKLFYPLPDDIQKTVMFFENWWVAWREGFVWERVWQTVQWIQNLPKDDLFGYYKYSVDVLSRQFQVGIPLEEIPKDPPFYIRGVFSDYVMAVNSGSYVMVKIPSMFLYGSMVLNSTGNQFVTTSWIIDNVDVPSFDVSCIINNSCVEQLEEMYSSGATLFWITTWEFVSILKKIAGIEFFLDDWNVFPY